MSEINSVKKDFDLSGVEDPSRGIVYIDPKGLRTLVLLYPNSYWDVIFEIIKLDLGGSLMRYEDFLQEYAVSGAKEPLFESEKHFFIEIGELVGIASGKTLSYSLDNGNLSLNGVFDIQKIKELTQGKVISARMINPKGPIA